MYTFPARPSPLIACIQMAILSGLGWLACLTHPDIVRGVHETYIRAGAEMIIANRGLALDAAIQTELPVWVGYSCVVKEGEVWLFDETERLVDAFG